MFRLIVLSLICYAPLAGCLNFTHGSGTVDFKKIIVGDYDQKGPRIWTNQTTRPAQLGAAGVFNVNGGAAFTAGLGAIEQTTVQSGASSGPVQVRFAPMDRGTYLGSITPTGTLTGTNTAFEPEPLYLKGEGVFRIEDQIIIDGGSGGTAPIDFGDVLVGTEATHMFDIAMPAGMGSPGYMFLFRNPAPVFSAPANIRPPVHPAKLTVTVTFRPPAVGEYVRALHYLTVNLHTGNIPHRFSVTLKGKGIAPPTENNPNDG